MITPRLKPAEVAALWQCSPSHVRELITSGRLKAINIGTRQRARYVIDPDEVKRFENNGVAPKPRLIRPRRRKVKQYF